MRSPILALAVLVLALFPWRPAAGEIEPMTSMDRVGSRIEAVRKAYGAGKVLVVFDIDDTLLKAPQDLGSVAWFDWQRKLKDDDPRKAARGFDGVLRVQRALSAMGRMEPTEKGGGRDLVAGLQGLGHRVMALTARGPKSREATLRELGRFGIAFDRPPLCAASLCGWRGRISKERVWKALRDMFALERIEGRAGFNIPAGGRPVSYADGVMMVAGLDKGAMLRLMLKNWPGNDAAAIVIVDDKEKNVRAVASAFEGTRYAVVAIHYTHEKAKAADFATNPGRQRETVCAWERLAASMCAGLGDFCRVRPPACSK